MDFREIAVQDLTDNVFTLIGDEWMLITAGSVDRFNTMTASWGGLGILWGAPVSFTFVRPQRYTREFLDSVGYYTLTFFGEAHRDALNLCGTKSGRDVDKMAATGLTPLAGQDDTVLFAEARLVLTCRKLYIHDIDPNGFFDVPLCEKTYPTHDYHRMYVGEIVSCLVR